MVASDAKLLEVLAKEIDNRGMTSNAEGLQEITGLEHMMEKHERDVRG